MCKKNIFVKYDVFLIVLIGFICVLVFCQLKYVQSLPSISVLFLSWELWCLNAIKLWALCCVCHYLGPVKNSDQCHNQYKKINLYLSNIENATAQINSYKTSNFLLNHSSSLVSQEFFILQIIKLKGMDGNLVKEHNVRPTIWSWVDRVHISICKCLY